MYYAPSDFRSGFVQQYARFGVMGEGSTVKILSMEAFGDVLEKAQCDENGTIGLTFPKEMNLQQVRDEWQWVNEGDNRTAILITENDHCDRDGTDGIPRQLWSVTEAMFDNDHNHVDLRAKPVGFQEAFGKAWHLKIGRDTMPSSASGPARRGAHLARIPINQNFSGVGFSLPPAISLSSLLGKGDPIGTLMCDPCYTKGQLDFKIDIGGLSGGTVHITAQDLETSLTMRLEVYQALASKKTEDHKIWGFVPPRAGIYIKNIIDIGPTIKLIASAGLSKPMEKEVALALGYRMTISDKVDFTWDILHPTEARLTSFHPKFETLPLGISKDLEIEGRFGPKLELSLDWTILGQGAKFGFQFGAATLSLNVSSDDREPACRGSEDINAIALPAADKKGNNNVTGVNFNLDLEQEILAAQSGLSGRGPFEQTNTGNHQLQSRIEMHPHYWSHDAQAQDCGFSCEQLHATLGRSCGNPKECRRGDCFAEVVGAFVAVTAEAGKIASRLESEAEAATSAVASVAHVVETKVESVAAAITSNAGDIGDEIVDTAKEIWHALKCLGGLFC